MPWLDGRREALWNSLPFIDTERPIMRLWTIPGRPRADRLSTRAFTLRGERAYEVSA